jgi:nascent polypeptide-associated complex subunit beta
MGKKTQKSTTAPTVQAPKTETQKVEKTEKKVPSENKYKYEVNTAKLEMLKKQSEQVRTGGKGSVRRKHKEIHHNNDQDDQKLQQVLKKQNVRPFPDIDEVNFFMEDQTVLQFKKPKVQGSLQNNTFVVSGKSEPKSYADLLPSLMQQMGVDPSKIPTKEQLSSEEIPETFETK